MFPAIFERDYVCRLVLAMVVELYRLSSISARRSISGSYSSVLIFYNRVGQYFKYLHGYLFGISSTEFLKYFKKLCIFTTNVFQVPVFPVLAVLFLIVFKKKGLTFN